jgi:DNA-binding NtrC family response regulator
VDVRVVAATNQPLRELVELNRFRRDLYFRLNVLSIELPPLRQRRDDIPLLVESFIGDASTAHARPRITISPDAMAILIGYDWPGNVRELKNLVESMVVLSPGRVIRPEDIPPEIRDARGRSRLLPVPMTRPGASPADGRQPSPELEFIFQTMMQLRMDMEELRRQFDDYRRVRPELSPPYPVPALPPAGWPQHQPVPPQRQPEIWAAAPFAGGRHIEDVEPEPTPDDLAAEHDVVVFRPGMTIAELEKNAIVAALKEVAGNRRKAAEMLAMGERTLYRKIKEYGIPL